MIGSFVSGSHAASRITLLLAMLGTCVRLYGAISLSSTIPQYRIHMFCSVKHIGGNSFALPNRLKQTETLHARLCFPVTYEQPMKFLDFSDN